MMGMGGGPQPSSFLGMGGMGGMGGMMGNGQGGNLGFQGGDPSLLGLNMNNPAQAQMWRQMGMGPL